MPETKQNVIALNSCPLGEPETEFWNRLFDIYSGEYTFKFFSTEKPNEVLRADEFIPINYGWTVFERVWDELADDEKALVEQISQKDHIWEIYEATHSLNLAASWFMFWTIIIKLFNPAKTIVWNGHHVPEAALAEVSKLHGVPCVYAERGPLRSTFAIDSVGVNYASSFVERYSEIEVDVQPDFVKDFARHYFERGESIWAQPGRLQSREEFARSLGVPDGKKVIFFPAQVDQDSNAKLFSPFFADSNDAVNAVVSWCNEHSDQVFILVKKHPMQPDNQRSDFIEPVCGRYTRDSHILDCIQYSDAVISVNSSAAVEAALLSKPVLILGKSILTHCDDALALNARDDLQRCMADLLAHIDNPQVQSTTAFFSKLLFGYLQSAEPEYVELGMRGPNLPNEWSDNKIKSSRDWLNNRVEDLGFLVPVDIDTRLKERRMGLQLESNFESAVHDIQRLCGEIEQMRDELGATKSEHADNNSNLAVRLLRKMRMMR